MDRFASAYKTDGALQSIKQRGHGIYTCVKRKLPRLYLAWLCERSESNLVSSYA